MPTSSILTQRSKNGFNTTAKPPAVTRSGPALDDSESDWLDVKKQQDDLLDLNELAKGTKLRQEKIPPTPSIASSSEPVNPTDPDETVEMDTGVPDRMIVTSNKDGKAKEASESAPADKEPVCNLRRWRRTVGWRQVRVATRPMSLFSRGNRTSPKKLPDPKTSSKKAEQDEEDSKPKLRRLKKMSDGSDVGEEDHFPKKTSNANLKTFWVPHSRMLRKWM